MNLKLLRFTNGYTQLKEVAKGVAVNGATWRSWDICCYVRLADDAENEVNAFCFTFHDPTYGQPGEPKMSSEIGAMLAIVRPNCAQVGVSGKNLQLCYILLFNQK